jgi:HEAT repeat protein
LSFHKAESFTQIDRWLNSKNNSVVEFALRLIEVYKLYDLHSQVLNCLSHRSEEVRKKAIHALNEIYQPDAAVHLIHQFHTEEKELQLLTLQLFEVHATENELPFLLQCLSHATTEIKAAAAKAVYHTQADGMVYIEQQVCVTEEPWTVLLPQLKREGS